MNIVILSYHFPPDISPASFRMLALTKSIANLIKPSDKIHVITSNPKKYFLKNYEKDIIFEEKNIVIHRSKIINISNSFLDSVFSYLIYSLFTFRIMYKLKSKFVLATSSRLMTALLCYVLSFFFKFQYIIDFRDIFSENIESITIKYNKNFSHYLKIFLLYLEKLIIKKALCVNVVSDAFKDYFISKGVNTDNWTTFKNGIDEIFLKNDYSKSINTDFLKILYVGNIGIGQGLEKIIPFIAPILGNKFKFTIIGSGNKEKILKKNVLDLKIKNIEMLGVLNRDKILEYYKNTDILFLHLNNLHSFRRVLPSKLFEYIAVGKPIVAGLPEGYARDFIKSNVSHCLFFNSGNINECVDKIKNSTNVKIDKAQLENFKNKFSRNKIINMMANNLIKNYFY